MSKYTFRNNQRYAVYKAFDGRCQWCREPVDFMNFHVDHVLPEELISDLDRLRAVLQSYGLDEHFNINDYENWIPAHPYCNQGKSTKVYEGAPFIRTLLDACARKKETAQRIEMKLDRDPQKAQLMAQVQAAIQKSLINIHELQNFILKSDMMETEDDDDLRQIREDLEQRADYQAQQMVADIMAIIQSQTYEVRNSILQQLGKNWEIYNVVYGAHTHDTEYAFNACIKNSAKADLKLYMAVSPDVIDKQLVIRFRDGDDFFDEYVCDVDDIDWQQIREAIRKAYVYRIKYKIKAG